MLQLRRNQDKLIRKIIGPRVGAKLEGVVIDRKVELNAPSVDHLINFGALDIANAIFRQNQWPCP